MKIAQGRIYLDHFSKIDAKTLLSFYQIDIEKALHVDPRCYQLDPYRSAYRQAVFLCSNLGRPEVPPSMPADARYLSSQDKTTKPDHLNYLLLDLLCSLSPEAFDFSLYTKRNFCNTFTKKYEKYFIEKCDKKMKNAAAKTQSEKSTQSDSEEDDQSDDPREDRREFIYQNFTQIFRLFSQSLFASYFQLPEASDRSNTSSPKFTSSLPEVADFLWILIYTIKKNPFYPQEKTISFSTLNTFFMNKFFEKLALVMEEDSPSFFIPYLAKRFFDFNTACNMVELFNKLYPIEHTTRFPIDYLIVMEQLVPIFFVQDPFSKDYYLDVVYNALTYPHKVTTSFYHLSKPSNVLAEISSSKSEVELAFENLKACNEYLLFVSKIYLPVLSACFTALLQKHAPQSLSVNNLKNYLTRHHPYKNYIAETVVHSKTSYMISVEKQYFVSYYKSVRDSIYDPLQHSSADSPLQATIKEQLGLYDSFSVSYVSPKRPNIPLKDVEKYFAEKHSSHYPFFYIFVHPKQSVIAAFGINLNGQTRCLNISPINSRNISESIQGFMQSMQEKGLKQALLVNISAEPKLYNKIKNLFSDVLCAKPQVIFNQAFDRITAFYQNIFPEDKERLLRDYPAVYLAEDSKTAEEQIASFEKTWSNLYGINDSLPFEAENMAEFFSIPKKLRSVMLSKNMREIYVRFSNITPDVKAKNRISVFKKECYYLILGYEDTLPNWDQTRNCSKCNIPIFLLIARLPYCFHLL